MEKLLRKNLFANCAAATRDSVILRKDPAVLLDQLDSAATGPARCRWYDRKRFRRFGTFYRYSIKYTARASRIDSVISKSWCGVNEAFMRGAELIPHSPLLEPIDEFAYPPCERV